MVKLLDIPVYVGRPRAFSNIQPTTYEDGLTYAQELMHIRGWLTGSLVPWLNGIGKEFDEITDELIANVEDAIMEVIGDVDEKIDDLDERVNAAVQQVINNSITLQDPVMGALVNDNTSETYQAIAGSFVTRDEISISCGDPKYGGLVSDGVAATRDGTDNAPAINAALADAASRGIRSVYLPAGFYSVHSSILVPSGIDFYGDGRGSTRIYCPTPGIPVIANAGYINGEAPGSNTSIRGFYISGEPYDVKSHGIVMFSYYSRVSEVTVSQCGGDGILLSDTRADGSVNAGTMVENSVIDVFCDRNRGHGIRVSSSSARVTDGFIQRAVLRGAPNITEPFLVAGSVGGLTMSVSAGWNVSDVHTYGTFSGAAIAISRAYSTIVDGLYIESGYGTVGLNLPNYQGGSVFDNLTIVHDSSASVGSLTGTKDGSTRPGSPVVIGSLVIVAGSTASGTAVTWPTNSAKLIIGSAGFVNDTGVTKYGGFGVDSIIVSDDIKVGGSLRDTGRSLTFNGNIIPVGGNVNVGGSGPKTVNVRLLPMNNGTGAQYLVIIGTTQNYSTTRRASYAGILSIGRSGSGTVTARLSAIGEAVGFSTEPSASIVTPPEGVNGVAQITFEFSATDGYGSLTYVGGAY